MKGFKDARRRMKQQALQTLGVAEATEDSDFKEDYYAYKNTCVALKSLRKSMEVHLDTIRAMQASAAALTVELAAFHQHTQAAKATVALGQAHAEAERVNLASVERLYEEEVTAATELLLWQVPEVEDNIRRRKKLLLDYDAHLRKYENAARAANEMQDRTEKGGNKAATGKLPFTRRKSESQIAEEITQRKVKVEQAEAAVDESTKWLMEQFEEMDSHHQSGALLKGPMSALLACQLHYLRETMTRLEEVKPLFESTDLFAATLQRYDKEPPRAQELDVEGMANITNLNATVRRRKTHRPQGVAFGLPLSSSTPPVVCDAIAFIRAKGLHVEGIFRVSASKDVLDQLRALYDDGAQGAIVRTDFEVSVHDAAGLLKLWFRELPHPLIPTEQYESLVSLVRGDVSLENPLTVSAVLEFSTSLPAVNRELLGFLAKLLAEVADHEPSNKMSAGNLATCLAPSLLRAPEDVPPNIVLRDMQASIAAIKVFIMHADRLPQPKKRDVMENTRVTFPEAA
ncbi:Rho GTPase activating protein, putative [Hondaea fermentalgiana]|uniref:Rho GTPase activating protein, putative n=1 Tax=Hondaea fermentalgiana TaxID=2315210 RepID=A0A2R5GAF7_9STRA|nr:Rho GTPase activating protein, putative [Hondaea fermentalgiana]|eukprot:GBG24674.1 Rho GTPase activating protein, putative [Hondaea fermentalgiana]